jgi:4-alpha-glucanotransferase
MHRTSGVLLHVTSLPGEEGIGTLGDEALRFVRFLQSAGQSLWQMLPMHITSVGDSPFQGPSVFAGNPNVISLRRLSQTGDLSEGDYDRYLQAWHEFKSGHKGRSDSYVEYGFLWQNKLGFDSSIPGFEDAPLRRAYVGFKRAVDPQRRAAFDAFCAESAAWLDDFAHFMVLKDTYGFDVMWPRWQVEDLERRPGFNDQLDPDEVGFHQYVQFVFDEQMKALHREAAALGVELMGDMAIYPGYDGADVWSARDLFQLDGEGYPTAVAAVPPDFFSREGQLWGNPLYKWGSAGTMEDHAAIYRWWSKRMKRELSYFDLVKIDHFRGFDSYGAVRAESPSAARAWWMKGPGREAFDAISRELDRELPVVAEDLGLVSDGVRELLVSIGFAGMKVLAFADWRTGDPKDNHSHPYLPHNVPEECNTVYYTGTHDNGTFRQIVEEDMTELEKRNLTRYVARSPETELRWRILDVVSASGARRAVFPAQDMLWLGAETRMNNPADRNGCWRWRLGERHMRSLETDTGAALRRMTERNGRLPRSAGGTGT